MTLKEPQENPHAAFCCRGCFEQYHRRRCVVCEREYERIGERQRLCGRRKCKSDAQKFPAFYQPFDLGALAKGPRVPKPSDRGVETLENRAFKSSAKSLRAFVWVPRSPKGGGWQFVRVAQTNDLDPRPVALVQQRGNGYQVTRPQSIPEAPIESFGKATHRAEAMVLWNLPTRMPTQPQPTFARQTLLHDDGAFRRAQGDAVLSDWKPYVTLETDIPDIPEFLRRR
jgi:hypothetical protein